MSKSYVSTDPQSHKGSTNTWLTPLPLIRSLGEFDLDPCGFKGHRTAKRLITLPNDGLETEWSGRVWLNPPYGKHTQVWVNRLKLHGDGIALVFNRLDTKWLQPLIQDGFFAIQGRISFLKPDGQKESNAGTGSILIPYGKNNVEAILKSGLKGRFFK